MKQIQGKRKNKNELKYDIKALEKEAAVVCQDFSTFCDYIMEKKVKLSKKTGNIGKRIALH